MLKIKNGGLDQYRTESSEQQQFGTAGVKGVNDHIHQWTKHFKFASKSVKCSECFWLSR